jgi:hypothetical protein
MMFARNIICINLHKNYVDQLFNINVYSASILTISNDRNASNYGFAVSSRFLHWPQTAQVNLNLINEIKNVSAYSFSNQNINGYEDFTIIFI